MLPVLIALLITNPGNGFRLRTTRFTINLRQIIARICLKNCIQSLLVLLVNCDYTAGVSKTSTRRNYLLTIDLSFRANFAFASSSIRHFQDLGFECFEIIVSITKTSMHLKVVASHTKTGNSRDAGRIFVNDNFLQSFNERIQCGNKFSANLTDLSSWPSQC